VTTDNTAPANDISPISIEEEMQKSYLDYAMSVIVSRALPDVRDGLKPVHRRILYAMDEGGYASNKPYKKSARIVGDVMGKYHPHGDAAMTQVFSLRLTLVDGQGNFGSIDGDNPAAMRYTEARMGKPAESMLDDIGNDTVDFQPNYDESVMEPVVLPARFPNLLVNGASGIAVGMATNIPPHNLGEVIDGCCAMIDNAEITTDELIEIIPGPDFPTGGQILGRNGIQSAYHTGKGSVIMRAKTSIEEMRTKQAIIVHEIPYQVNKSRLMERIAEVSRDKIVEGISEARDESDRDGMRVVIELKRDAIAEVVLNQLYRYTQLQTAFSCNILAIHKGRPQTLLLKDIIHAFIEFREEVITRRTIFKLNKARDRAHLLAGLAVAVANIDEIIALIRNAADPATARAQLLAKSWATHDIKALIELIDDPEYPIGEDNTYQMSAAQVKAILDLRLHRLTGLERDKIASELQSITEDISEYLELLSNRDKLMTMLREELIEMKDLYATPRRTELCEAEFEVDLESLIQREEMVVTVSHSGYVKRVPLSTYRAQRRGGKGRTGMNTKDEDFVTELFVTNTHTPVLFFTSRGIVHKMKAYLLPEGSPTSRGKAFVNLLPLEKDETISVVMPLPEDETVWDDLDIIFATSHGSIRRNKLSAFKNIRANGLIAMKLEEHEQLIAVRTCTEDDDIVLSSRLGKTIRFPLTAARVFASRNSTGVRGIRLAKGDEVMAMSIIKHTDYTVEQRAAYLKIASKLRNQIEDEDADTANMDDIEVDESILNADEFEEMASNEQFLMAITTRGFGKRTSAYEYRTAGRGGQGIWNMKLGKRNGEIVTTYRVDDTDQIMMVTDGGQLIRMAVSDVRFVGRQTQGVTLFRIPDDETVVSVGMIREMEDDGEDILDEDGNTIDAEVDADGDTDAVSEDVDTTEEASTEASTEAPEEQPEENKD